MIDWILLLTISFAIINLLKVHSTIILAQNTHTYIQPPRQPEPNSRGSKMPPPKDEDDSGGEEEEEEEDHENTLCGSCGDNYGQDEFWICCDACETWFHGKCVKITPAKAEHIKHYKCPNCSGSGKRARA